MLYVSDLGQAYFSSMKKKVKTPTKLYVFVYVICMYMIKNRFFSTRLDRNIPKNRSYVIFDRNFGIEQICEYAFKAVVHAFDGIQHEYTANGISLVQHR